MSLFRYKFYKRLLKRISLRQLLLLSLVSVITIFSLIFQKGITQQVQAVTPWPTTPPAQICGNTDLLNGPSTAPSGAVIVPAGDNSTVNFTQANTTYWFAPGTHTLGTGQYSQIIPGNNATFLGAPGAIIDGQHTNFYAFTQHATGVTIKYLTIQNFGVDGGNNNEGVVNHDAGQNWTISYNTIKDNAGAGVFIGSNDTITYNCLTSNGQYGFSVYDPNGVSDITLDHNEISYNDTYDWEAKSPGCGCTGGGKFWNTTNAIVTNNYVHDNHSVGLWADTNNNGFDIENNYISNNYAQAIFYEISYNALIRDNNLINNGWGVGPTNPGFPTGAIYISESGGDSRVSNEFNYATIGISDNNFVDNWGGVILWENANRFCGSPDNTSSGVCTLVSPSVANVDTCNQANLQNSSPNDNPDYYDLCRWKTQNVSVSNNTFDFTPSNIGTNCTTANECGFNGIFSEYGTDPSWSPYKADVVEQAITFNQNNSFSNNTYTGAWQFMAKEQGTNIDFSTWQATPYNQDAGSTLTGGATPTATPTPTPPPAGNALDADTSTLEGSIGKWEEWYGDTLSQSTDEAHSGTHSLKVAITDTYWGVQLSNYPGFVATPGKKLMSFWAKLGSGTALQPTLTVQWLDNNSNILQTDNVTMPTLTTTWRNITTSVTAPAGTSSALVYITGYNAPGDYFYIDDVLVNNYTNLLDADTANLENSTGQWVNWFSSTLSQSSLEAQSGTHSLQVAITAPYGWAATLNTWPGLSASAGNKVIRYWAKLGVGTISNVTLYAQWYDTNGNLLQTDAIPVSNLSTDWKEGAADLTAPSGTSYIRLTLYSPEGDTGDSVYFDNFIVADAGN